jgi:hypothetical protein
MTERLALLHTRCAVTLSAAQGKLRAELYQKSVIREEQVNDDGSFLLKLELSNADFGWLQKQLPHNSLSSLPN